jgi:hypothetical protein
MSEPTWVVMPFVDLFHEFTLQAACDVLAQTSSCRLLLIDNGSGDRDRRAAGEWVRLHHEGAGGDASRRKLLLWHHAPPLPTLDATWNRALEAAWEAGAERALVVNNDVRLHRQTLELLERAMDDTGALFVSAVNVGEKFQEGAEEVAPADWASRGGPDYSCFLISRECHEKFPFDPQFTWAGDLDHHRRVMLAGEGKRIFSVCVPYLHFASRTMNKSEEAQKRYGRLADEHRALYREKWGGGVNEERWLVPYGGGPETVKLAEAEPNPFGPVTTPELQRACLEG